MHHCLNYHDILYLQIVAFRYFYYEFNGYFRSSELVSKVTLLFFLLKLQLLVCVILIIYNTLWFSAKDFTWISSRKITLFLDHPILKLLIYFFLENWRSFDFTVSLKMEFKAETYNLFIITYLKDWYNINLRIVNRVEFSKLLLLVI